MKVQGLDKREYTWPPPNCVPPENDRRKRSALHLRARKLLRELFSTDRILEEVSLPGTGGLTADFYIPSRKTIVEVQGEQHLRYTPHFHGTIANFFKGKANDRKKEEWCHLNNIEIIYFNFDKTDEEWQQSMNN